MGFFKNAASVLLTSAATIPIGVLASVVLARGMSVEDRGLFGVAASFANIAALVAALGWPTASIYRLKRRGADPAQVVTAGLVANAVIVGVVLAVGLAFEGWFRRRMLDDASATVFHLALAQVAVQLVFAVFSAVARGLDRFDWRNRATLLSAGVRLGALAFALLVARGGVIGALWAVLLTQAALTLVFGVAIVRRTGLSRRLDRDEIRDGLSFGLRSWVQNLAGELHEKVDVFLLAYFLDAPEEIAVYAVAAGGVIGQLKLVPESIGLALFPRLAGAEPVEAGRFTALVSRHSTAWVVLLALGLAVVGPLAIPLMYGAAYERSVPVFFVLLPAMALLTVYRVLARYFIALGQQRVNIGSQLVALSTNVGLNAVLIPRWGILGAAWASLASYALEAVMITVAFQRATGHTLRETFGFGRADLAQYRARWARLRGRVRRR